MKLVSQHSVLPVVVHASATIVAGWVELYLPRVCWFQNFSRDALHEIYELAVKYDGTISERDKYIRGVLLAMSFDPPHEFICRQSYKIARDNRYLPLHVH